MGNQIGSLQPEILDCESVLKLTGVGAVAILIWKCYFQKTNELQVNENNENELNIGGEVDAKFLHVREIFRRNFLSGQETQGAALCVYHKGQMVVDIWGGYADIECRRLWQRDTVTCTFSASKAFLQLATAHLVSHGRMKYDDLVSVHWPEFAQNGKHQVTVRMLVSHQAGLPIFDSDVSMEQVQDSKYMSHLFEQMTPLWTPGTRFGYHTFTIGWIMDQLVRRVDTKHRPIGQYIKEELCQPFSSELVHIGLPVELEEKVTRVRRVKLSILFGHMFRSWQYMKYAFAAMIGGDDRIQRSVNIPRFLIGDIANGVYRVNNPAVRRIPVPAASGFATARALAAPFNAVLKHKLIDHDLLEVIRRPTMIDAQDFLTGERVDIGHGFQYNRNPDGAWTMGHNGHGGQNVKLDIDNELVIVYVTNDCKPSMTRDFTTTFLNVQKAIYDCL